MSLLDLTIQIVLKRVILFLLAVIRRCLSSPLFLAHDLFLLRLLTSDYLCVCTDGRPAPPLKGQLRRKQEKEALAVSVNTSVSCRIFASPSVIFFKFFLEILFLNTFFSPHRDVSWCWVRRWMQEWRHGVKNVRKLKEWRSTNSPFYSNLKGTYWGRKKLQVRNQIIIDIML